MDTSTQIGIAALLSVVIQCAKKSSWFPWITTETDKLNRWAAIVLSGAASIGIHATFNHATGSLLIEGLTLSTIAPALWHWFMQFLYTHGIYKTSEILPALRRLDLALQVIYGQVQKSDPTQGVHP